MIYKPSQVLQDIAMRMASRVIPELGSEFGQADAGILVGLLATIAQDYERAAYNLDIDIREIKELFAQSPTDAARANFIEASPESLLLSDLTDFHASGLSLLIELHAWAEEHDAALDRAIWAFLRQSSERQKFELPGF